MSLVITSKPPEAAASPEYAQGAMVSMLHSVNTHCELLASVSMFLIEHAQHVTATIAATSSLAAERR